MGGGRGRGRGRDVMSVFSACGTEIFGGWNVLCRVTPEASESWGWY